MRQIEIRRLAQREEVLTTMVTDDQYNSLIELIPSCQDGNDERIWDIVDPDPIDPDDGEWSDDMDSTDMVSLEDNNFKTTVSIKVGDKIVVRNGRS